MAAVISLREVIDAIESLMEDWEAYLDPDTGEIVSVSEDDRLLVESNRPEEELPAWQREILPKVRAALESGRFLRLPNKFDLHEWAVMDRFSRVQENPRAREELMDTIHGPGAFRMFRSTTRRLGLEDAWHKFRDQALEEIARDWLEEHHLAYK